MDKENVLHNEEMGTGIKKGIVKEEVQIASKHMKCSTVLAIKKDANQNCTKISSYLSQNGHIQEQKHAGENVAKQEPYTLLLGMQISTTTMKIHIEILQKPKIELPFGPVILLLGIYPKEHKSGYNRDICTQLFIIALFTIAKLWK
jgi:hypothetical protein